MKKTTRFVIWICSKFTRKEIEQIIHGLMEVLANRNPEVKPKDDFKENLQLFGSFSILNYGTVKSNMKEYEN